MKPLFKRAILQSGSPLFLDTMTKNGRRAGAITSNMFLDNVACTNTTSGKALISCLRNKTTEEILVAQEPLLSRDANQFDVNLCDSSLSPVSYFEAIRGSQAHELFESIDGVLFGSNHDELSLSLVVSYPNLFTPKGINLNIGSMRELRELIVRVFSPRSSVEERQSVAFMADYFFSDDDPSFASTSTAALVQKMYKVFGDAAVACPINILAEEFTKLGKKVWLDAQRNCISCTSTKIALLAADDGLFICVRSMSTSSTNEPNSLRTVPGWAYPLALR